MAAGSLSIECAQANGLDPTQLARFATEAYLIQILKTGFFHADPHPGNVAVDTEGNLVYYDFGSASPEQLGAPAPQQPR